MSDRERFEAWAKDDFSLETDLGGNYKYPRAQAAWQAWQAAQAQSEPICDCPAKDMPYGRCCKAPSAPVAWLFSDVNGKPLSADITLDGRSDEWRRTAIPLYTSPPAEPDMVSVPKVPTPEMIKAGTKQIRHAMDEGLGYTHSKFYTHEVASLVYKAMIEQGAAK